MENAYKRFYNSIAKEYDNLLSEQQIVQEVDYIESLLTPQPKSSILDIGCGTGRHSIEFAKRGYIVTGLDFSNEMIVLARQNAKKAGVSVNFIEASAEDFTKEFCSDRFDIAISLHEGGLCLLNTGESEWGRDMAILGNMSDLLKPGGKYYITVLNAIKMMREISNDDVKNGLVDLWKSTKKINLEIKTSGNKEYVTAFERYYTPAELTRMVNRVHLKLINVISSLNEQELVAWGTKKSLS